MSSDAIKVIISDPSAIPLTVRDSELFTLRVEETKTNVTVEENLVKVLPTFPEKISVKVEPPAPIVVRIEDPTTKVLTIFEGAASSGGGGTSTPMIDPEVTDMVVPSPLIFLQRNMKLTGTLLLEGEAELLVI